MTREARKYEKTQTIWEPDSNSNSDNMMSKKIPINLWDTRYKDYKHS